MARIVRSKKKRNKSLKWSISFLLVVFILKLFSSIFLNSYSNNITVNIQNNETKIRELKTENAQLRTDIQVLQNKERIFTIATENGLEQQDNVISIKQN